jgi:hypothetical protein
MKPDPRLLVLAITSALAAWPAAARSPAPASGSSSSSDVLQEVTVTARHIRLGDRVAKFVNRVTRLQNGEGLARWQRPACPLVLGLDPQQDKWILERVSSVARVAKVPFDADERCHPKNLFIFVNGDPRGLLQRWDDRNSARVNVFGGATPLVVKEFIGTPRAVRVWYRAGMGTAWGLAPSASTDYQSVFETTGGPTLISQTPLEASHLSSNVVYTFSAVFVIADSTRLHGVTLGQLADYAAMVGLAEIEPGAQLGDAPAF